MSKIMRIALIVCLLHAFFAAGESRAAATEGQSYPTKMTRLLVGFNPGAGADFAGRLVATKLQEVWGQSVIVENRPGAGGNRAADFVAKSTPDGYTLLLTSPGPIVINQSLMAKMPYDPLKDLAPVAMVASGPNVLVVRPDLPVKNVKELIALARASKNLLNYGSSGVGSTPHMAVELFKMMAKVNMVHVPYKGSGEAVIDLMGGQIDLMITTTPAILSQVKSGRLRALAVTPLKRSSALPDIPTLDEAGLTGYEFGVWWGLFAPARTPAAVIDKINQSVASILRMGDVRSSIAAQGADVAASMTPKEFADYVQKEAVKWEAVIKTAGIKAE